MAHDPRQKVAIAYRHANGHVVRVIDESTKRKFTSTQAARNAGYTVLYR